MWLRGLSMALAASWAMLTQPAFARAESTSMVCVVRVDGPTDAALLERIRGQTSDLPLTIETATSPVASELRAAELQGEGLARSVGARAVVWFSISSVGDITIFVEDAESQRLFARRVFQGSRSSSATLEMSSLLVREVLLSLLEGKAIGPSIAGPTHDASDEIVPALLEPCAPLQDGQLIVLRAPVHVWTPFTAIGPRVVFSRAVPSLALNQRIGVARESLAFGVTLTLGAEDVRTDAVASIMIRRHALGAFGEWRWNVGNDASAALDVEGGMMLFVRSSRPAEATFVPSATQVNVHAFVGPEARFTWAPRRSWIGVSFAAGADFVFASPTFRYEGLPGKRDHELALWPLQPHVTLGLEFRPIP